MCRYLYGIIIMALPVQLFGSEQVSAVELLDGYIEAGRIYEHIAMTINSSETIEKTMVDGQTRVTQRRIKFGYRRDNLRAEWSGSQVWYLNGEKWVDYQGNGKYFFVFNGKDAVLADDVSSWGGRVFRKEYKDRLKNILSDPALGSFCFGYGVTRRLGAGVHLGEFIKPLDGVGVLGQEVIEGTTCHIVGVDSPYGEIKVWIAPEKGYHALKIEWISDQDDTLFPDGRLLKETTLSHSFVLIDIEVQEVDGLYVPTSGHFSVVDTRANGTTERVTEAAQFSHINLDPDLETPDAFKINLPDGTILDDQDSPGVLYTVIDGKLNPPIVQSMPPVHTLELGDKAPELQIAEWVKGTPVDVTIADGKQIFVVEFWATWCKPCLTSIPHLTTLQQKYKNKDVTFIGVSIDSLQIMEKVKAFVKDQGDKMNFTVAIDKNRATSKAYMDGFKLGSIPCAFIIDREGRIVWHGHPMEGLETVIDQVIDGTFDLDKANKEKEADTPD